MNDDLRQRVIEDLNKTGFGSEMKAIRLFLQNGWLCSGSYYYFDEEEGKNRETDLVAEYGETAEVQDGVVSAVSYTIVAEVKKSEKPWIVFKAEIQRRWQPPDAWSNLIHTSENLAREDPAFREALRQNSLWEQLNWKGYAIHEYSKKPDDHSRWYSAFIAVCKASASVLAARVPQTEPESECEWVEADFVKPVVILDGSLLTASLTEEGAILLEEAKYAPFEFFHKFRGSKKNKFRIDVVTLDHLPEYIEMSEARALSIRSYVKKTIENTTSKSPPLSHLKKKNTPDIDW